MFPIIFPYMAAQMVDSTLPSTRQYWRRMLGFSENIVTSDVKVGHLVEKVFAERRIKK